VPKFGSHTPFGRHKFGSYVRLGASPLTSTRKPTGSFSARGYYLLNGATARTLAPGAAILTSFGTFIRGIDVASQALKNAVESSFLSYDVKVYLQDASASPKWVDLTDVTEFRGKNALVNMGRIEYIGERHVGAVQQRMGNIVASDVDGFWSRPWVESSGSTTSKIRASYDANWNFLDGSAADTKWNLSINGQQTALFHHKVAVRVEFQTKGGVPEIATMGVFLVESVERDGESQTATISLAPLTKPLLDTKADVVKEGAGWYRNRNIRFLAEELLKVEYAEANGQLPSTWDIENIIDFRVPLEGRQAWLNSHLGRPPERMIDATLGPNTQAVWVTDPVKIARAHVLWEYGNNSDALGSISVTPGSPTVTGAGTAWESGDHPVRVGDSLIIPRPFTTGDGGSVSDNDDRYVIVSINSDTSLTLDKPANGSAAETGLKYSINRLYLGVGDELYEYNQSTDVYYKIGSLQVPDSYIFRIWHNVSDTEYPIWGVHVTNLHSQDDNQFEQMKIFRFKWDGTTPVFDIWGEGASLNASTGLFTYRNSDLRQISGNKWHFIGNWDGFAGGVQSTPMTLPFTQTLVNMSLWEADRDSERLNWVHKNNYITSKASFGSVDVEAVKDLFASGNPVGADDPQDRALLGHWHVVNWNSSVHPNGVDVSIRARYSMGQIGAVEFNPNWGTNGVIFYPVITAPAVDTDTNKHTEQEHFVSYRFIDLSQDDPDDPSPGTPDFQQVEGTNLQISGNNYGSGYLPMASASDPDSDHIFIAASRFAPGLVATDAIQTAILRFEDLTLSVTPNEPTSVTQFYRYPVSTNGKVVLEMKAGPTNLSTITFAAEEFPGDGVAPFPYFIHSHEIDGAGIGTVYTSNTMLQGLISINIGAEAVPDKLFVMNPSRGQVVMIDDDRTDQSPISGDPAPILSTIPAVEDASFVMHGQVSFSKNTIELYWTSSPLPYFTIPDRIEGRFLLSRFSPIWPARVAVADFSDMSLWDGIRHAAEVTNSRFGFRPDGNFYLKSLPRFHNSSYTFSNVDGDKIQSISVEDGNDDIVNEAIRIPYIAELGDIDITVRTGPNSKVKNFNFDAVQRTERPINIRLYCVRGGSVKRAEWLYITLRGIVKTKLRAAYIAGQEFVRVENPLDTVYGSFISVNGVDTNDDEISASNRAGRELIYSTVPLVLADVGMDVETAYIQVDSVTFPDLSTVAPDNLSRPLVSGDVLIVGNFGSGISYEYMVVTGMSADRIYVSRGSGGGDQSTVIAHAVGEEVRILRNNNDIFTFSNLSASLNFSIADEVTIEHPDENVWSENVTLDPANFQIIQIHDDGAFRLIDGSFVAIGGDTTPHSTGISIKATYTGPSGDRSKEKFKEGDIIRISAAGIVASPQPASKRTFSDLPSQARHNKRTDDNDNVFLSPRMAEFIVRREVQDNSEPRYLFTIQSILTPWLMPMDIVDIQDLALLPRATEHKESTYITNISFNVQTRGLQTITTRGTKPY
jgi:hypothetical protein